MSTAEKIGIALLAASGVAAVWLLWLACEWAARQVAS
jgi:hypothetical protein